MKSSESSTKKSHSPPLQRNEQKRAKGAACNTDQKKKVQADRSYIFSPSLSHKLELAQLLVKSLFRFELESLDCVFHNLATFFGIFNKFLNRIVFEGPREAEGKGFDFDFLLKQGPVFVVGIDSVGTDLFGLDHVAERDIFPGEDHLLVDRIDRRFLQEHQRAIAPEDLSNPRGELGFVDHESSGGEDAGGRVVKFGEMVH